MESIKLPSTLKILGFGVFKGCRDLKKTQMHEGLEYIGYECFAGSGITELVIPKNLTGMGWYAF